MWNRRWTMPLSMAFLGSLCLLGSRDATAGGRRWTTGYNQYGDNVAIESRQPAPNQSQRATGSSWNDCFSPTQVTRGEFCGDASSVTVKGVNRCTQRIFLRLCFQRTNHTWDCGADLVRPGDSSKFWSCHDTGRYLVFVRSADDSRTRFPTEQELERTYH